MEERKKVSKYLVRELWEDYTVGDEWRIWVDCVAYTFFYRDFKHIDRFIDDNQKDVNMILFEPYSRLRGKRQKPCMHVDFGKRLQWKKPSISWKAIDYDDWVAGIWLMEEETQYMVPKKLPVPGARWCGFETIIIENNGVLWQEM